jgi:hypothetical protein
MEVIYLPHKTFQCNAIGSIAGATTLEHSTYKLLSCKNSFEDSNK